MNWKQVRTAVLAGTIALPTSFALAQTSTQGQHQGHDHGSTTTTRAGATASNSARGGQQASRPVQMHIAQGLRQMNMMEVELGELGQQQAQSQQVKQFAQRMQEEHQQLIQQMDQALGRGGASASAAGSSMDAGATSSGRTGAASSDSGARRDLAESGAPDNTSTMQRGEEVATRQQDRAEAAGRDATASTQRAGGDAADQVYGMAAGTQAGGSADIQTLSQIDQQYHQRKLQSMRQMLSKKQGSEFDKAYMGHMIMSHQAMLDKLQTVQGYMPQEAQSVLEQATEHTQQHLQEARQIMQQLDKS